MTSLQICTFTLDRYVFGIDVRHVQEVLRLQTTTRVPLAPALVSGLLNLRGQIVTAFHLRERLRLAPPDRDDPSPSMTVVLRREDGIIALLVDDIGDVVEIDERRLERPPQTLRGPMAELVRWVVQTDSALLLVLDPRHVTDVGGRREVETRA
jgi:purine-binding chemotaxis protein CheW